MIKLTEKNKKIAGGLIIGGIALLGGIDASIETETEKLDSINTFQAQELSKGHYKHIPRTYITGNDNRQDEYEVYGEYVGRTVTFFKDINGFESNKVINYGPEEFRAHDWTQPPPTATSTENILSPFISLLSWMTPNAHAAFGLTQSPDLENGSSHYFSRADTASLSIIGDLTLELWVNVESDTGAGNDGNELINKWTGANWSWGFFIEPSTGFLHGFVLKDGSGTSEATGTATNLFSDLGTWHHVAMTFTAATGEIDFFVDGSAESHTSDQNGADGINDNNHSINLGTNDVVRFFDGRFSLVRVWSEVRTATELNDNKCEVLGATANLAAEWTLDNTVNDNSGNSNTFTNNNSVPFGADVPTECAAAVGAEVSNSQGYIIGM